MYIGFTDYDESLLMRPSGGNPSVTEAVEAIIEDVRKRGDAALYEYAKRFDGSDLRSLYADAAEIDAAEELVSPELKVYNTICRATLARQQSVCRLAREADGIIVLGGKNSANTRKLAEIASLSGVPSLWIEHAGELDGRWLENKRSVGIAAGGSTPDWLIKELIQKLEKKNLIYFIPITMQIRQKDYLMK